MRILNAAELAQACAMRNRGDSWRKISRHLRCEESLVRDTLVPLGYKRDSRLGRQKEPPGDRQRAYQMYVVQR